MRRLFTSIAPTIDTGVVGFIVFLSFLLSALVPSLPAWRAVLIEIAVIIAGFAVVLGLLHLMWVHIQRMRQGQGVVYSGVLVIFAVLAAVLLFLDRSTSTRIVSNFIFNDVVVPMQTALGALLTFFLALAAFRMMQRQRSAGAVWFLLSAVIVLITQVPLPGSISPDGSPTIVGLVRNVLDAATTGGMRGLLLGVALGTIATAFRVLFFIDRPQSE